MMVLIKKGDFKMSLIVLNSNGDTYPFKPIQIREKLVSENGLSEDEADKVARSVVSQIHKEYENEITTAEIRALVTAQLIKRGKLEEAEKSAVYGLTEQEWDELVEQGCQDNANIGYHPEMIAKYTYDAVAKNIALAKMPRECAEAHKQGYFHIHDMEYYLLRPNCFLYSIPFIAKNGLNIDGKSIMGSVAKPAKSLSVLLRHMAEAWMAGGNYLSGGQAYAFTNVYLAPYCVGMSYKEIEQQIEAFVFDANQSLVSRGGQVLFTSLNLEFEIPDFMKDIPAVSFGGIERGVYGDYEEECKLLLTAFINVLNRGDAKGRPHRFPNCIFMIRDGTLDKYEGNVKLVHELVAKFPTIYFGNCTSVTGNRNRTYMGCRTQLRDNWTGDWEYDTLNVGNFMYNTLNLPLMAKESESIEEFEATVKHYCDVTKKSLSHRRECICDVFYNKHLSDFLLQEDENGKPLYDLDKMTFSIGFCGLEEAMLELYDKGLTVNSHRVIEWIDEKCKEFKETTGWRWSVFASPAESTAHRFAEINKAKYPDAHVKGDKGSYYLTNSHHLPVDYQGTMVDHILNGSRFGEICSAGAITHLWTNEAYPDPVSLWKLNQRIAKTQVGFWAFTNVFSCCNDCEYVVNEEITYCPKCRSHNVTNYSRVTGYYLPYQTNGVSIDRNGVKHDKKISLWNKGKMAEVKDRFGHKNDDIVNSTKGGEI